MTCCPCCHKELKEGKKISPSAKPGYDIVDKKKKIFRCRVCGQTLKLKR